MSLFLLTSFYELQLGLAPLSLSGMNDQILGFCGISPLTEPNECVKMAGR